MAGEQHLFTLHRLLDGASMEAGAFAIELRENGSLAFAEFRYAENYIRHPQAIPLMPGMPLKPTALAFACSGEGVPGFIDELLPDAWGRRLIAHGLSQRGLARNPTLADLLSVPAGSLIGCFTCAPYGDPAPTPTDGLDLVEAGPAMESARRVDRNEATELDFDRLALAGASSPKGARPKLLVRDEAGFWLAKLERGVDVYDVVLAEHAALQIARDAGLDAPASRIVTIEGVRALLVERFDRDGDGQRSHLVSANALLKDPRSQEDRLHASYDDLAKLIRDHSDRPAHDLRQLLGQVLLNSTLRNTDDHLRNFSFLADCKGMRLSPAYDIVPTPTVGAYHQLGWGYGHSLPRLSSAREAAQHLGVPASQGDKLARDLGTAIARHAPLLREAGALTRAEADPAGPTP